MTTTRYKYALCCGIFGCTQCPCCTTIRRTYRILSNIEGIKERHLNLQHPSSPTTVEVATTSWPRASTTNGVADGLNSLPHLSHQVSGSNVDFRILEGGCPSLFAVAGEKSHPGSGSKL